MLKSTGNKHKAKALRRRKNRGGFLKFLALVLLVLATFCAAVYFIFLSGPWEKMHKVGTKAPVEKPAVIKEKPSVPSKIEPSVERPAVTSERPTVTSERPTVTSERPAVTSAEKKVRPKPSARIAIIIDDMGYRKETGERLIALDLPLAFAFLPQGRHTRALLAKARQQGRDILLHFPMEPEDAHVDAGPGLITVAMDNDMVHKTFEQNLAMVPGTIGINNHMGSKFTRDREASLKFLKLVKGKKLFFLDSRTGSASVAEEVARELGIKTGHRHVFLDNDHALQKVAAQLEALIALALKHGSAIAIGHPTEETLAVLTDFARRRDQRVMVVPVHELLN